MSSGLIHFSKHYSSGSPSQMRSITTDTVKSIQTSFAFKPHLVVDHSSDSLKTFPFVRDIEGFENVRERCIISTNPADGRLQV